ncbi:hypothetical protein CAF53_01560 [Sphingobium sp. LB126]|uniref:DUF2214 family protein n=1 Tax=Sphingobium sp. LB126 TaxID=1983755 RepID=UPI000C1FF03A|nr:DUF2214 family protein [Sphingobium sp. LB126]PJG47063.1 hypothetical protein CAF53_01560 [Sphingobium sp. LB126]
MNLASLWHALEASSIGSYVASSDWVFPTLETAHVISIVAVVGYIVVMDLRLLGIASTTIPVTRLARATLPYAVAAFVIATLSGVLLFVSKAAIYMVNPYFLAKLVLLALAGANVAVFHIFTWRTIAAWDGDIALPSPARAAGLLSLTFWIVIVFCSRMIGYTLGLYE